MRCCRRSPRSRWCHGRAVRDRTGGMRSRRRALAGECPARGAAARGSLRPARLARRVTAVAYDRRGYGESTVSTAPFTHVEDLLAVLDQEQAGRAWLVGASAGGGLALDAALLAPDRVAGLVLLGTAVSGAPEP